jgi:hypothetical protein
MVLFYIGIFVYIDKFAIPEMIKEANERRLILLYRTDHATLLDECRKLIKESREGKWPEECYYVSFKPQPDSAKLPEIILNLNPTWVSIGNERVMIEMHGGLDHFGVRYFSKRFSEVEQYGNKKLLDGLWYYDDGYRKVTNYDQHIESLRPE